MLFDISNEIDYKPQIHCIVILITRITTQLIYYRGCLLIAFIYIIYRKYQAPISASWIKILLQNLPRQDILQPNRHSIQ